MISKTSPKGAKAHFPTSNKGGTTVRVSPGKGGVRVGPTHCTSKRAHANVKSYA